MSGGFEAAGDAITGGVIAHAVEPASSGDAVGDDEHTHENLCLNCVTPLLGSYCHACGQAAHLHRSLAGLWHDIAHGVFHFEGKVWRTLPMLALRPGSLTRRYIHGERARFVSPLALFLFSVFLMFAVFEGIGGPIKSGVAVNSSGANSAMAEMTAERDKLRSQIVAHQAKEDALAPDAPDRAAFRKRIDQTRREADGLDMAVKGMSAGIRSETWSDGAEIDTGNKQFDARMGQALKNPKLLLYKIQSSAYKFSWALIPLSLPFMWAMFAWRPQYRLYDHAVFVTYSLSFVMFLLVAMALVAALGIGTGWALLLIPVHFFVQLKGAYSLGRASALWRTVALLMTATTTLALFATVLLILGLLG